MSKNNRLAFSLIELMVVIGIVAILSVIAIPVYSEYTQRVKLAQAFAFLSDIKDRSIIYHQMKGVYPTAEQLGYVSSDTITLDSPKNYIDLANEIAISTSTLTGACAGVSTRGTAHIILDENEIPKVSSAPFKYIFLQWLENTQGIYVTFCNDNSSTIGGSGNDWIGENCTYLNDEGQEWMDSAC